MNRQSTISTGEAHRSPGAARGSEQDPEVKDGGWWRHKQVQRGFGEVAQEEGTAGPKVRGTANSLGWKAGAERARDKG